MNEIEELKAKIEELNKQFAELLQKQEIKEEELGSKVWKPIEDDDKYYAINCGANIFTLDYDNSVFDKNVIEYGNCFKTYEEAIKQTEFNKVYNRFRKYVEAYSEPLDWDNREQKKYYVYYSHNNNRILYCDVFSYAEIAFQIYASSSEILRNAVIYSAGSEKEFVRIVFGVEE